VPQQGQASHPCDRTYYLNGGGVIALRRTLRVKAVGIGAGRGDSGCRRHDRLDTIGKRLSNGLQIRVGRFPVPWTAKTPNAVHGLPRLWGLFLEAADRPGCFP